MKYNRLILFLLFCIFLTGCAEAAPETAPATEPPLPETTAAAALPPETAAPTEPVETQPEHSEFYIPGLSVDDVILYFNEVCLDAEFVNSGDASVVQKWVMPIRFLVLGSPTEEDLTILSDFSAWLNTIEGFPGISETQEPADANLRIHFCDQDELLLIMGDQFTGMDGAVTFWYENDEIYDATICYRTDLDQKLRNSVILEEIYNGLGPIQDTNLRPDSIIYFDFTQPQELTEIDELILRLLYHPDIRCGMTAAECEAVIRNLYY